MGVFLGLGPSAQMHEVLELCMPFHSDTTMFLLSTIGNSIVDVPEGGPTEVDILWFALLEEDLGEKIKQKLRVKEDRLGVRTAAIGPQNNAK